MRATAPAARRRLGQALPCLLSLTSLRPCRPQAISLAWRALSNKQRRASYDAHGLAGLGPDFQLLRQYLAADSGDHWALLQHLPCLPHSKRHRVRNAPVRIIYRLRQWLLLLLQTSRRPGRRRPRKRSRVAMCSPPWGSP